VGPFVCNANDAHLAVLHRHVYVFPNDDDFALGWFQVLRPGIGEDLQTIFAAIATETAFNLPGPALVSGPALRWSEFVAAVRCWHHCLTAMKLSNNIPPRVAGLAFTCGIWMVEGFRCHAGSGVPEAWSDIWIFGRQHW